MDLIILAIGLFAIIVSLLQTVSDFFVSLFTSSKWYMRRVHKNSAIAAREYLVD